MTSQCEFAFRLIDQGACLGTSSDGTFLLGAANQIFIESVDGTPRRGFEACAEMVKAEALRRNGTCRITVPPPVVPPDDGIMLPPVIPPVEEEDEEVPTEPPVTPPGDLIPGIPNILLLSASVGGAILGGIIVGSFLSQGGRLF